MKAVKVQYTVKNEYIETNKRNIQKVMDVLKSSPVKGMQYSSFTNVDSPNTFIHINMAKDEETMGKINDIKEFKEFQQALKASQPLAGPTATKMNLVGCGFDLK